jgi:hypothetical protein
MLTLILLRKQHDSVVGHSGLALTLNQLKGEASEEIHVLLFYYFAFGGGHAAAKKAWKEKGGAYRFWIN